MAKGFDVLHLKSAVKAHNRIDLSHSHLTTMDFGQIVPLYCEETIQGDKFSIDASYFSRMAPLVKPTYGKFTFKTVTGFVPYHQIAYDADAWLAGKTTWEGVTPIQRYITIQGLFEFFRGYCSTTFGASSSKFDLTYVDTSGTTIYCLFTTVGRYYIKVLNSLGYAIPEGVDYQTTSVWNTTVRNVRLSAYPLLAFFKLYNDYMSQSQRYNSSILSSYLRDIKYNNSITGIYSNGALTSTGVNALFTALRLNYENDYFTSAWQQPNNAINSVENISNVTPPISNGGVSLGTINDSVNDTILTMPVASGVVNLGERALQFLNSFWKWVHRNNYSGSRAVQQLFSRFGIKTDDYMSHYAHVYATDVFPIQVGDVTATADAANVPLGDYAGKGIMNGGKSYSIDVNDYGMIFILGYFTVNPMMSFGYDRRVLRNSPLDYYNPEFDGIGADAITVGEVWASPRSAPGVVLDTSVFGFTERFNSYRYSRDVISGDFRDYRTNGDMSVWHSGRNLEALRTGGQLVAQSSSMNTLPQYNSEYNRIFSVTSGDVDHFYMTCKFDVSAVRPILNLNQVVDLGEGDTAVPRNGNVIS